MKIKHNIILLLSLSFVSIPVVLQAYKIQNQNPPEVSECILTENKESFIFEAPDYLINKKSSLSRAYVLLKNKIVPVYAYPTDDLSPIDYISKAEEVYILESTEKWYKILYKNKKSGYVLKKQTTENKDEAEKAAESLKRNETTPATISSTVVTSDAGKGQEVVNCAKKYLGVKYVYGGTSPSGFDCSGLVQYVCKSVGISVNRTAASQFNNGKAVNKKDLLPGDLLFFAKNGRIHHVSIYAGDGQMIHAPHTGDVVKLSDFNTPYRQREFVGARRVF